MWPHLLKQNACFWQPLAVVSRTRVFGTVHIASSTGAGYLQLSATLWVFTLLLQPSRSPPRRIIKLDHHSSMHIRSKASQARGQRPRCPEGLGGTFRNIHTRPACHTRAGLMLFRNPLAILKCVRINIPCTGLPQASGWAHSQDPS